jgi:ATP-dependent RNA/DNA helicase IGHMBP2
VIQGPPGTGKTTTIVELIKKACLNVGSKVLCCAPSNIAVDNIAEKLVQGEGKLKIVRLGHPARFIESVQEYCFDSLAEKADITHNIVKMKKELDEVLKEIMHCSYYREKKRLLKEKNRIVKWIEKATKQREKDILESAHVIL